MANNYSNLFENYLLHRNCSADDKLLINFEDLSSFNRELANWIQNNYLEVLPSLCLVAKKYFQKLYQNDIKSINVCFHDVPTKISQISTKYINKLVSIEGRCIESSPKKYKVEQAVYRCTLCTGIITNAMYSKKFTKMKCLHCNMAKYEFDPKMSTMESLKQVLVQQSGSRQINVTVRYPKFNEFSLGKNCKFFGTIEIQSSNVNGEFHDKIKHRLSFLADHIQYNDRLSISPATNDKMYYDENLLENIICSMFPNFYGFYEVKFALLLQAIGGVSKITIDNMRLRGDIHVLLVGDASTGKSNLKKIASNFWEIAVETCGRGCTDAGLTAGIVTNENTGENEIRAGAIKLAHNGVCCIDEFDKLPESTHNILHEAMEQQTISINKAGNMAKFDCHTSILASGNPQNGILELFKKPAENIKIKLPLMSRFDLIFYMSASLANDRAIATNIINQRCDIPSEVLPYTFSEIKSYIIDCRKLRPILVAETANFIANDYKSITQEMDCSCISRTLESIIRLSEAFAKFERADTVSVRHAETVIGLMQYARQYTSAK